jgi:hypothetical protein
MSTINGLQACLANRRISISCNVAFGEPNDSYPNLLSPVFNVIAILLPAASRRVFLNIPKHLRLRESRARRRGEYW